MIMISGTDKDFNIIHLPFCLKKMNGGVTAWDLVMANFEIFSEVIKIKNSAYEELKKTIPDLPKVLLLGKVMKGYHDPKNHHTVGDSLVPPPFDF